MIAATKLRTVTDLPLHFKAMSITLQPDEWSSVSAANDILYQMSGSTEVSPGGAAKMLKAGEGLFIAGGETAALTTGSGGPSTFLHFFLIPAVDLGWQKRLMEAKIWPADLVHLKGLGFVLCRSMKVRMSASSCLTEVCGHLAGSAALHGRCVRSPSSRKHRNAGCRPQKGDRFARRGAQ